MVELSTTVKATTASALAKIFNVDESVGMAVVDSTQFNDTEKGALEAFLSKEKPANVQPAQFEGSQRQFVNQVLNTSRQRRQLEAIAKA